MDNSMRKTINRIISLMVIFSFLLGNVGWYQYHQMYELPFTVATGMFLSMQLFTVNTSFHEVHLPLPLEIARFLSPLSLATAILGVFFALFRSAYVNAIIRFRYKNHFVFYGFNTIALELINSLLKSKGEKIVVILPANSEPIDFDLNKNRVKFIEAGKHLGDSINQAQIKKAKMVLLLSDDDTQNMQFVSALTKEPFREPKSVMVRLNRQEHVSLFNDFGLKGGRLTLHVFSIHQKCAAYVVDGFAPDTFSQVDPDDPQVSTLIVGFSEASMHLLTEAVQMYHFANLKKPRFILSDHQIREKYSAWKMNFPMIEKAADIHLMELNDLLGDDNQMDFKKVSCIFVCGDGDSLTSTLALRVRQVAFNQTKNNGQPPVIAVHWQMSQVSELVPGFYDALEGAGIKLADFRKYINRTHLIDDQQTYDTLARYINAYYEESWMGRKLSQQEIDEKWQSLPDRLKESNRLPARHLPYKLRIAGLEIVDSSHPGDGVNLEDLPEELFRLFARIEKNRWNAEKYIQGFVPGEYQSDKELEKKLKTVLKVHPALKPWDEISAEEQAKDATTMRNITKILERAGLKLIRS